VENQPVTTEGSALVEAHIRVPGTNELIPFFTNDVVFVSATITESVEDLITWEITVRTASRNFVDNFLKKASAGATPRIRVRLGLGTASSESNWLPWQELIVRQPISRIEGLGNTAGYHTTLIASDLLWEINRVNRVTARKGTVSSIVQNIADSYGLPAVIEPTKYEGLWIQSYTSDYEFIKARMMYRALNDKGRGNYKFFMRDNVLHFHTIDYQTSIKEFGYHVGPGSRLILTDASQEILADGGAGFRYTIHDPYSGVMQEITEDRKNVLILGNESPLTYNIKGVQKNVVAHVGANRIPELLALTNSRYEDAKSRAFRSELTIPQSVFFRAGDIVNLVVNPEVGQTTPTSGYYYVPKVVHVIDRSSLVSAITFERGEWQGAVRSQSALLQSSQNVITTQNSTTGQGLNLNAASSSQLTRGAGKEASRKLFLDARNPNTAPN
jgi:hypothetical protein